MKLNALLLSALMAATAGPVLAQAPNPTAPPPVPPPPVSAEPAPTPAPAPSTETPAKKPAHKHKPKAKAKHAAEESGAKTNNVIVLNPPVTATVKCNVLDVRGQPSFVGEVIGHVKKGDSVTVVEEITHAHAHGGEPKQWSKIMIPTNVSVWVSGQFVNSESKEVRVKKVNLRGGPGENFSVVGGLEKGAVITEIERKSGWIKIEPPTNAFAYVASEYLEAGGPAPAVASAPPPQPPPPAPVVVTVPSPSTPVVVNIPPPSPPPSPVVVNTPQPPAATGLAAPAPTAASQADQENAAAHPAPPPPAPAPIPAPAPTAGPGPTAIPGGPDEQSPRVVTREGFVHRSYNIQAPTGYELHDIKTGELIEYLEAPPGSKLKGFVGSRVRITGSEYLDERWQRTPILRIQTLDLMP